jgi:hypothetical protein
LSAIKAFWIGQLTGDCIAGTCGGNAAVKSELNLPQALAVLLQRYLISRTRPLQETFSHIAH